MDSLTEPRRAIPVLVLALAVGGCAPDDTDAAPRRVAATLAPVQYQVTDDTVRLTIEIRFHEDRTLVAARVLLDQATPVDVPAPLAFRAGESVRLETTLSGTCPDPPQLPVFEITTESATSDRSRVDHFLPVGDAEFESAFATWCGREVSGPGGLHASAARRIPGR
jgi:hypothetical protein